MLNCEEFVTMAVHLQRLSNDDHLRHAFQQFDKNKSGYIEFEDLKISLFDDNLAPTNDQVITDIIFDADLDKVISLINLNLLNNPSPMDSVEFEVYKF